MRVLDIIENQSIIIDEKVVLRDEYFDIIANNVDKKFYSVAYKPVGLEITASNYIGTVPINKSLALNIKPKIGIKNFFYILLKSERELNMLEDFMRKYNKMENNTNLIDLLTIAFLKKMQKIEREGIYRDYVRKERNSSTTKGKILFKEHITLNVFKNIDYRVVHSFQELDRDILSNQVIKLTVEHLIRYYRLFGKEKKYLRKLLYLREVFSRVSYVSHIIDFSQQDIKRLINDIPQIRSYYVDVLETCFLIMKRATFQFEKGIDSKGLNLPSIYINTEDVFERFLLNALVDLEDDQNVSFYKGKKYLFSDVSIPRIEPDIVIEENKVVTCIADAKYKGDKPKREDIFQMISYLVSYNCEVGVFILPKHNNATAEYLGTIDEKCLYVYRVNLNHLDEKDIKEEELKLHAFLKKNLHDKKDFCEKQKGNI
ncbi:McrC family protein [Sporosarcina sp. FSL W7-1283]|uniref:McrC family protein n=1 Tax=Sporosarcina sp. FSL W7-1283 TaxID=2921560 RepID=UPI0030F93EBB